MMTDAERAFYLAGYDAAVKVIEDRYYGVPTKDMIRGWFSEARQLPPDYRSVIAGDPITDR